MKFFNLDMDETTARNLYVELSKRFHSDKGGNDAEFIEMKAEYEDFCAIMKHAGLIQKKYQTTKVEIQKVFVPQAVNAEQAIEKLTGAIKAGADFFSAIRDGIKEVNKLQRSVKK